MSHIENKKILIVDDEPEMTEELKEILESENYKVIVAHNGIEALEFFSKELFDLILLDIKMPKMDGVETYRKMKQVKPMTPIIIITGSFARKNAERVIREGASDVVYKPFDVEKLFNIIKKHIKQP